VDRWDRVGRRSGRLCRFFAGDSGAAVRHRRDSRGPGCPGQFPAARHRLAGYRHAESLLQAANYIEAIQNRQGWKVCCPEEIAYRAGFIDAAQLEKLAGPLSKTEYGQYLISLLSERL
jgi:hypothetical protein